MVLPLSFGSHTFLLLLGFPFIRLDFDKRVQEGVEPVRHGEPANAPEDSHHLPNGKGFRLMHEFEQLKAQQPEEG